MGSNLKSLTSFFVPITRFFGFFSAACAVWVIGRWIYYLLSPSSVDDGSNGYFEILLIIFLSWAALCLSVRESKPHEVDD